MHINLIIIIIANYVLQKSKSKRPSWREQETEDCHLLYIREGQAEGVHARTFKTKQKKTEISGCLFYIELVFIKIKRKASASRGLIGRTGEV